ncbi:hypothetical protein B296_00051466 [Ensete ventricosum]|uniref:Plant heme peroxidase family profile domain-containing protein n=1 Tax=Ensete ventricosum TaxID=4639 RepID=A0A426X200_ENSVE|nr:hypothetical protein B296_00051466 [Ensete ventricosum]
MSFRGPTILVCLGFLSCVHADLKLGFYDNSCPKAEKLILDFVGEHIPNAPTMAASLLRMHFHDCFVRVIGCNAFVSTQSDRLYNFTGNGDQDPSLDGFYATNLKKNKCRDATDETTLVEMDPGSFRTFDVGYYRNVLKRRGLFESDAALTTDAAAKAAIVNLVDSPPQTFFAGFAMSMEKMGSIGVKTGSSGEIRRNCGVINS